MNNGAMVSGDRQNVYKPASWAVKMDFINHIILNSNVMTAFVGENGGGKSTFAGLLLKHLDPQIQSVCVQASPLFDEAAFNNEIRSQLQDPQKSLEELISNCNETKRHVLVIIDDAHFLPYSYLENFLSLLKKQGTQGYFHICLFGNEPLMQALAALEPNYKEMIHTLEIGHLNEKEMMEYIPYRLAAQSDFISQDRAKQFFQLTDGSIVGINTQMSSFFNLTGAQEKKPLLSKINSQQKMIIMGGAVVIALGLAFAIKPSSSLQPQSSDLVLDLSTPAVSQSTALSQSEPMLMSRIPPYDIAAFRQAMQIIDLKKAQMIAYDEDDALPDDSLVVMDKVVVAPKVIEASDKKHNRNSKIQPSKPLSKDAKRPAQLLASHYTIQLLAGSNLQQLKRFGQRHQISSKMRILQSTKNGKALYVLTFGDYESRNLAKQALTLLPDELAVRKPWVRAFGDLKEIG